MKRFTSIALLLFLSLGLMSQTDTQEYKTIFKKDRTKHGAYAGLSFNLAKINDESSVLIGAKGGWIVDHKVVIGFAGSGFISDLHFNTNDNNNDLAGGYGGFMLEYIILPSSPVHISIPLLLGAGGIAHTKNWNKGLDFWDEYSNKADAFFVIESGVEVELNLVKFMRLALGLTYRHTSNIQLEDTNKDALNGLSTGITIKFGKF